MKTVFISLLFVVGFTARAQTEEEIVEKRIDEARKLFHFSQDYQAEMDKIVKDYPRSAYAWQQKQCLF